MESEDSLDALNNLVRRCDFEIATNPNPSRCTRFEYELGAAYTAVPAYLRSLVKKQTVEAYPLGTAVEEARVTYAFDNYGDLTGAVVGAGCPNTPNPQLTDRAGISGMEPERGQGFRCRGNVTREERGVGVSVLSSVQRQYDIAGNTIKITHPAVKTGPAAGDLSSPETIISYVDNFVGLPAVATFAFPTTITHPGGLVTSAKYQYGLGAIDEFTDPNSQVTRYEYSDALDRLTRITQPIGETIFEYDLTTNTVRTKKRRVVGRTSRERVCSTVWGGFRKARP